MPITYGTNYPDFFNDQQTGQQGGDLVGDINHAAFYTQFDDGGTPDLTDGTLAFRVRLAEAKNYKKMEYPYVLFVGIDATADGVLDLFVGVDKSVGDPGNISIWYPGSGANICPSTTTIESPPIISFEAAIGVNYDFSLVTANMDPSAIVYDVDGGGQQDVFISFSLDFNSVVSMLAAKGIAIDQNTPHVSYVMATATQPNSLNMDINGVDGGVNSSLTYSELGVLSTPMTITGQLPEPAVAALIGAGGMCMLVGRRLFPSGKNIQTLVPPVAR